MLIYASVNSAFSGFASLEIPLVIHVLREMRLFNILVEQSYFFCAIYIPTRIRAVPTIANAVMRSLNTSHDVMSATIGFR